jgi:hypothetical protein
MLHSNFEDYLYFKNMHLQPYNAKILNVIGR